ncbi:mdis1-interacting receptor like kinase 2 [Quercus suber]|uniref:non-specific serine/threonine protein kinase n=1 Tax=Quercus suber TaxID=58331 RepID=A0AAW0LJQ7_QUESU
MCGPIPLQLENLSGLVELYLGGNNFSGTIPSTLGLLTCLTHLDLHSNQINSTIPSEIYNLENLMVLQSGTNNLFCPISSKIGNLKNVVSLNLSHNLLIGPLPHTLTNLRSLVKLNLGGNFFYGTIPTEICNIKGLMTLHLGTNNLFGPLPYELSRLTRLQYLNLSSNKLSGRISTNLQNLVHLSVLDLSLNKLSGPLPTQLTNLHALEQLLLGHNNLTGSIPRVAYPFKLTTIDLSHNLLSGEIPPQLGNLSFLQYLDLSNNYFTGNIPPNLVFWRQMNLSYNSLTGPLPECFCYYFGPETIMDNKDLCWEKNISGYYYCFGSPHINIGSTSTENVTKWIKIILPIVISFIFLLLGIVLLSRQKLIENTGPECKAKRNGDIFSIWNYDGNIALEDIITTTEDFDIRYCIGTGGYASVYRAMLPSGKVIALKKLHRLESQKLTFDKSFRNEAKVLSEVRYHNILKLYGYCLHRRCMFLVYEYMEKGSLFYAISNDVKAKELDWKKRVNIIKGIANALSCLHHDCIPTIIHRDLTTSNILLNSELEAFVANFGIARPLNLDSSNLTTLAGTYGYIALVVTLALACLCSNPKSRPTMKHVSQEILARKPPLPKPFYEISMWDLMNQEIYLII